MWRKLSCVDWLTLYPQYLQLLGVGMVWITLHCAGMCGPIVVGLDLGGTLAGQQEGQTRRGELLNALINLSLYQVGRSMTYALLGALAGWGGMLLQDLFRDISRVAGLVVAALLLAAGLRGLLGGRRLMDSGAGIQANALTPLVRWARRLGPRWQRLALGIILGWLPCMIPLWVLGLSASTQSPVHGALLMVLLVWMTSLVIFGVGLAPALLRRRPGTNRWLLPALLLLSGGWMGLVSAGANGWIESVSIGFTLWSKGYTIMLW